VAAAAVSHEQQVRGEFSRFVTLPAVMCNPIIVELVMRRAAQA
jgi:hypothetical protein